MIRAWSRRKRKISHHLEQGLLFYSHDSTADGEEGIEPISCISTCITYPQTCCEMATTRRELSSLLTRVTDTHGGSGCSINRQSTRVMYGQRMSKGGQKDTVHSTRYPKRHIAREIGRPTLQTLLALTATSRRPSADGDCLADKRHLYLVR